MLFSAWLLWYLKKVYLEGKVVLCKNTWVLSTVSIQTVVFLAFLYEIL